MPAPQRSGQLSSFAAALLHSSLLRAADALLVPSSGEYELTAQTAAAYSTVCQQPCHLCCLSPTLTSNMCVQATEPAPSPQLAWLEPWALAAHYPIRTEGVLMPCIGTRATGPGRQRDCQGRALGAPRTACERALGIERAPSILCPHGLRLTSPLSAAPPA